MKITRTFNLTVYSLSTFPAGQRHKKNGGAVAVRPILVHVFGTGEMFRVSQRCPGRAAGSEKSRYVRCVCVYTVEILQKTVMNSKTAQESGQIGMAQVE